ncbi:hypothetical protein KUV59_08005, partial [Marinobacter daepoensis]|uniref:hypothetical protein n=1 Tax=Marinobacter daepoensis TaxID=262077 RepID=UPI001C9477E0
LYEEFVKPFSSTLSSGYFQFVPLVSGLSLRSGAHSTALRNSVNGQFELFFKLTVTSSPQATTTTLAIFFLPA